MTTHKRGEKQMSTMIKILKSTAAEIEERQASRTKKQFQPLIEDRQLIELKLDEDKEITKPKRR